MDVTVSRKPSRVAAIEGHIDKGEPLPTIIDDILICSGQVISDTSIGGFWVIFCS